MAEELIGIIGGTGLGESLGEQIKEGKYRDVTTPFGRPSQSILVGMMGKRRIAFLNRHGKGHKLSPSEVPYAANIYALKKIGCRTVLATGAVGSLNAAIKPGEVVIVDQFIDKTFRRQSSFFNGYGAVHVEAVFVVAFAIRLLVQHAVGLIAKAFQSFGEVADSDVCATLNFPIGFGCGHSGIIGILIG